MDAVLQFVGTLLYEILRETRVKWAIIAFVVAWYFWYAGFGNSASTSPATPVTATVTEQVWPTAQAPGSPYSYTPHYVPLTFSDENEEEL